MLSKPSPPVSRAVLTLRARCPDQWQVLQEHLLRSRDLTREALETSLDAEERIRSQGDARVLNGLLRIEQDAEAVSRSEAKKSDTVI